MQAGGEPEDVSGILDLVRKGDESAAQQLVLIFYPLVIRIVRTHSPRSSAEEDIAQEIFIKMFTRLEQYKADAPFGHWLSRIAINTCRDHLRSKQRRPELRLADLSEEQADWIMESAPESGKPDPGEQAAASDLLNQLLEMLPAEDQIVIRLQELEGKSILEICEETGWGRSLVKIRAFRARAKLKKAWEKLEKESERA
jgi:RNA polymerase sigma factor (sigma-70 family)